MSNYLQISIIIVTYNAEKYIERLLSSLRDKITPACEVLIIDGLSTDNTVALAASFSDVVTKIVSEVDHGIYDAMEKGVSMARGKFIFFLGADDELILNLNELASILMDENTVYYGDVLVSPSGERYAGKFNTSKIISKNICHQSIFYPRNLFETYKFNKIYVLLADYELNLRLWSSKFVKFEYFGKVVSKYSSEGLSSVKIDKRFRRDSFMVIFKHFGLGGILLKLSNPIKKIFKIKNEK